MTNPLKLAESALAAPGGRGLVHFFIDRPVFASVLSIIFVLLGGVAAPRLAVEQYPNVVPPLVQVTASYPGASGQLVSDTVATPVEQQVNGADNMLYMESIATADGALTLNITFDIGTDPNIDQVLTQNRVSMAVAQVPETVQQQGLITKKSNPSILLGINLYSPDGSRDRTFLSNYFKIQVYDELQRLPGVAQVNILGQRDYSMRVWLDPDRLTARNLTGLDVVRAVREQNVEAAAGTLGQAPVPAGQEATYVVSALGRLETREQFENIVVKVGDQGELVRVRDVGRVELGAQSYTQESSFDGKPAVMAAIFQLPGTNALDTAKAVRAKMEELKRRFPEGVAYATPYDTTQFIREAAAEVVWTLFESSFLVALVIFIFLQSWRTSLIPLVSLPVSVIGTFAVMAVFGFSFNNLSLFGLVLAIGIVVDDAIVVVENVERNMELGLSPRAAAHQAMSEITGAVIAMTLVLSCVFIPAAFISGITGLFYRQFALTIASATLISGVNSLTLSPALCALLLKPKHDQKPGTGPLPLPFHVVAFGLVGAAVATALVSEAHFSPNVVRTLYTGLWAEGLTPVKLAAAAGGLAAGGAAGWLLRRPVNFLLRLFFDAFNRAFHLGTRGYRAAVSNLLRATALMLCVYVALLGVTYLSVRAVPGGFIPEMDKGYVLINVKLPDGASLERTGAAVDRVADIARGVPGVEHAITISGYSLVMQTNSTSAGTVIATLKPFDDRHAAGLRADAIIRKLRENTAGIREAVVMPFGAPAVDGLGKSGGFKLQVQDRGNLGPEKLEAATRKLIRAANAQPGLSGVGTTYTANLPQLYLDIDRDQVKTLKVRLSDIFETLQIYVGSLYVNQINLFGRTWQVNVQAEAPFRLQEDDIARLQVRNQDGQMVRLGAVLRVRRVTGPERVSRYNMYPSADVMGATAPGTSSGQAIDMMNDLARRELPPSMTISWTDLYYQQIRAGNTSFYVFLFAAVMVMLVLAAQYESWFLPLAVILIVPLCILAAMAGVLSRGMDNNIFTQVGLLVLVGLAAKNAILIVEFAKQKRDEGVPAHAATVEAAGARLRPILMTSACFVHMVPLFFAVGAGAEMRRNLGTAVLCGAMGVTLFGIFLTPVFFYLIDWLATRLLGERVKTVLPADGVGPMPVAPPVPETAVTAQPPPG